MDHLRSMDNIQLIEADMLFVDILPWVRTLAIGENNGVASCDNWPVLNSLSFFKGKGT